MKKVFFIYPPSISMNREGRCQQPLDELMVIPKLPPLELMYLAAIAKDLGFECKIKDYSTKDETFDDLKKDILEFNPDIVLSNVATPSYENDLKVFKIAKALKRNIVTIATGAYFLLYAKDTLLKCQSLDFIIRGEAEFTFKEFLQNKELRDIQGLVWRDAIDIVQNEPRQFIENLDELPFPARELVDNSQFRRPDTSEVQTLIKVSRGCPFHCFFCLATPVSGSKVRMRSPENIVSELKECVEKYNIKNFVFWSDVFDIDSAWVQALCSAIIESGLKITWSSNTRADLLNLDMAKLMYSAGCRLVSMGIESGSQEILDKMGKNLTLDKARTAVKIAKKAGLKIYNYFVIGLPWENATHINQTINFAIELDSDFVSFYTATALPGSKFYQYIQENHLGDLTDSETYKSAYFYPSVKTHYLSKEQVLAFHKKAMKKFYLRPSYILKKLFSIKSFTEFKNYFKSGLGLLLKK